jgi:magnesium chelatase family protein
MPERAITVLPAVASGGAGGALQIAALAGPEIIATVLTRSLVGLQAEPITVEVIRDPWGGALRIEGGNPPRTEACLRVVRRALADAGYDFSGYGLIVRLSPVDLLKDTLELQLPIALALLAATQGLPAAALAGCEFYGCFGYPSELREETRAADRIASARGGVAVVRAATEAGHRVILPQVHLEEACVVPGAHVAGVGSLRQLYAQLASGEPLSFVSGELPRPAAQTVGVHINALTHGDQRVLMIAAAGAHPLLLVDQDQDVPLQLARRLQMLLPPLTSAQALDAAALASSSAWGFRMDQWGERPLHCVYPRHTPAAALPPGAVPFPGRIPCTDQGVLCVRDLHEFGSEQLQAMEEVLRRRAVTLSYGTLEGEYPVRCQLLAATQPQTWQPQQYWSGDFAARFDLQWVRDQNPHEMFVWESLPIKEAAARVANARRVQLQRAGKFNAELSEEELARYCPLGEQLQTLLRETPMVAPCRLRIEWSVRRVARTLADLDGEPAIQPVHLREALALRCQPA